MDREKYFTAIVAYNRPSHLKRCIDSIKIAKENFDGEISFTIVIDKDNDEGNRWKETLKVSKESGFNKVLNNENKGLRNNILGIIGNFQNSHYDRLIIIEDDILIKENFFNLFKKMFDDYESDNKVFQISGFSPLTYYLNPTVLYPRISTWGWGMWKNKLPVQKDIIIDWNKFKLTKDQKSYYNKYFPDVLRLHKLQRLNKINAWSLDYLHYMVKNELMTAYPTKSYVENIGFDGSGTNMGNSAPFFVGLKKMLSFKNRIYNKNNNKSIQKTFLEYYNNSLLSKIKRKIGLI